MHARTHEWIPAGRSRRPRHRATLTSFAASSCHRDLALQAGRQDGQSNKQGRQADEAAKASKAGGQVGKARQVGKADTKGSKIEKGKAGKADGWAGPQTDGLGGGKGG